MVSNAVANIIYLRLSWYNKYCYTILYRANILITYIKNTTYGQKVGIASGVVISLAAAIYDYNIASTYIHQITQAKEIFPLFTHYAGATLQFLYMQILKAYFTNDMRKQMQANLIAALSHENRLEQLKTYDEKIAKKIPQVFMESTTVIAGNNTELLFDLLPNLITATKLGMKIYNNATILPFLFNLSSICPALGFITFIALTHWWARNYHYRNTSKIEGNQWDTLRSLFPPNSASILAKKDELSKLRGYISDLDAYLLPGALYNVTKDFYRVASTSLAHLFYKHFKGVDFNPATINQNLSVEVGSSLYLALQIYISAKVNKHSKNLNKTISRLEKLENEEQNKLKNEQNEPSSHLNGCLLRIVCQTNKKIVLEAYEGKITLFSRDNLQFTKRIFSEICRDTLNDYLIIYKKPYTSSKTLHYIRPSLTINLAKLSNEENNSLKQTLTKLLNNHTEQSAILSLLNKAEDKNLPSSFEADIFLLAMALTPKSKRLILLDGLLDPFICNSALKKNIFLLIDELAEAKKAILISSSADTIHFSRSTKAPIKEINIDLKSNIDALESKTPSILTTLTTRDNNINDKAGTVQGLI